MYPNFYVSWLERTIDIFIRDGWVSKFIQRNTGLLARIYHLWSVWYINSYGSYFPDIRGNLWIKISSPMHMYSYSLCLSIALCMSISIDIPIYPYIYLVCLFSPMHVYLYVCPALSNKQLHLVEMFFSTIDNCYHYISYFSIFEWF